jgi:hypothetical protein
MGRADYLELGTWNALCSLCGRKRKANTMVKNWQGLYRCPEHDEPRHPQDFVRAVPDVQTPPWVQRPPADVFVVLCSPTDRSALPDLAIPDCVLPEFLDPGLDLSKF